MPPEHHVIVVGASAGGAEALPDLVRGLPAAIPAAIFVTMQIEPRTKSLLPEILNRAGQEQVLKERLSFEME